MSLLKKKKNAQKYVWLRLHWRSEVRCFAFPHSISPSQFWGRISGVFMFSPCLHVIFHTHSESWLTRLKVTVRWTWQSSLVVTVGAMMSCVKNLNPTRSFHSHLWSLFFLFFIIQSLSTSTALFVLLFFSCPFFHFLYTVLSPLLLIPAESF